MRNLILIFTTVGILLLTTFCQISEQDRVRRMVDSTGFATTETQMDSINSRIYRFQGHLLDSLEADNRIRSWKTVICPHDDYSYVGYLYPAALREIETNTVILIGVAHKASKFDLQDKIVFGEYDYWQSPYGRAEVSPLREKIVKHLPEKTYTVHNEMQTIEHSLEPIIPFLQKNNPSLKILPVLVPYMSFDDLQTQAQEFSKALQQATKDEQFRWGKDYTIVISSDAVHYGDEGWGGKNFARYGADSAGYQQAVEHEKDLIHTYLTGDLSTEKVKGFYHSTVKKDNYKEYKWTWCGRYSIPFGLLLSENIAKRQEQGKVTGHFIDYSTSITDKPLPVRDISMGHTAPAHISHWVGYAAVGYD
jgi:AmmeMemoRadiSam system protein B